MKNFLKSIFQKKKEQAVYLDRTSEELTQEERIRVGRLVASPEFRLYEKHLNWRQGRLNEKLIEEDDPVKSDKIRGSMIMIGRLTNDNRVFWEQYTNSLNDGNSPS